MHQKKPSGKGQETPDQGEETLAVLETLALVNAHSFRKLAESWLPPPTTAIAKLTTEKCRNTMDSSVPIKTRPSVASLYCGEDREVVRRKQAILERKILGAQKRDELRGRSSSSSDTAITSALGYQKNSTSITSKMPIPNHGKDDEDEGGVLGLIKSQPCTTYQDPMSAFLNKRKRKNK